MITIFFLHDIISCSHLFETQSDFPSCHYFKRINFKTRAARPFGPIKGGTPLIFPPVLRLLHFKAKSVPSHFRYKMICIWPCKCTFFAYMPDIFCTPDVILGINQMAILHVARPSRPCQGLDALATSRLAFQSDVTGRFSTSSRRCTRCG